MWAGRSMGVGARPRRARYDMLCARRAGGTIDKFELLNALDRLGKKFSGQLSTTLGDLSTETGLRKLFDEIDRDKGARRVVLRPYS